MSSAVIVSAVRTAVATARKGTLANTPAEALAVTVLKAAVARAGLSPDLVAAVVFAESLYGGGAVARHAAVEAAMLRAGGLALNRHCAGSLSAVGVGPADRQRGALGTRVCGRVSYGGTR